MAAIRTCPECGTELPANAPQGLCPRCLVGMGVDLAAGPRSTISVGGTEHFVPVTEKPGDRIGRYKLLQKIGEGGMGIVYMAEQTEPVMRKVALKIIKLGMDTPEVIARFEAERQAIALMDHPNIARALDAGATEAGRPYFVMELVRGIPMTDYCDQKHLPTGERLQLFIKVCHAVQHAHQKGLIHRDLKPGNVLVTEHDGEPVPKVIDFGVAKALGQKLTEKTLFTAFQHMIGTPAYMSPEQAALSGLDIDTRADIYSLGVLLYELLTGVTPFDADTFRKAALDEIRRMIRETEPLKPSTRLETLGDKLAGVAKHRSALPTSLARLIRGDLDWIVMRCLEKDRKRRYETANGLAGDVARHLDSEPVVARPPSNLYRFQKLIRRHKLAFGAVTAVCASLFIGLGVSTWALFGEKEARRHADVAGKKAKSEAERAEAAATEAKITLAASDFRQAVSLVAQDNTDGQDGPIVGQGGLLRLEGSDALAYLVRSLSSNPTNAGALTRLASLLTHRSWLIPKLSFWHKGPLVSAVFSYDGGQILTGSGDTATVRDARTGSRRVEVSTEGEEIHVVRFSPDGKRFATVSGSTVRVWDAQTGRLIGKPLRHDTNVSLLEFSPDGSRIVTVMEALSGKGDRTRPEPRNWSAQVWDTNTGQALAGPLRHDDRINSVHFSPDGKRIVTASEDKTVRVWDTEAGLLRAGPLKHSGGVPYAEFSPDGVRILSVQGNSVYLWDAETGDLLHEGYPHSRLSAAHFSPDGNRIVTSEDSYTARVWEGKTLASLTRPMRHIGPVDSAQFSRDGNLILTIAVDYTVFDDQSNDWCKSAQVWDARSGKPVTWPLHQRGVKSAQFSPDGRRLITVTSNGQVLLWETVRPALTMPLSHESAVLSAEFSPDGRRIVSISSDGSARIWDAQRGGILAGPMKDGGKIVSAKFSPDGRRIITASTSGRACVWDVLSGRPLIEISHADEVRWAEFSPDGKLIVTASKDKTARVWESQSGRPVTEPLVHPDTVNSAQFGPDGELILTVCRSVRIWNSENGQLLSEIPVNFVQAARFSPSGDKIVALLEYDKVCVWSKGNGGTWPEPVRMSHGEGVETFQVSPHGARIATTAYCNYTAMLWDMKTGQPVAEPLPSSSAIGATAFSSDSRRLVTVERITRVWDTETGQLVAESPKHDWADSVQFSPDGERVVVANQYEDTGEGKGMAKASVWDVAPSRVECPAWLLQLAEAVGGKVINKLNVTQATKLDRTEVLDRIRKELESTSDENDWVVWGRWFLADPGTRTISPFCGITVPAYIESRIKEHTAESLEEAERLASGYPELLQRISDARRTLDQAK